MHVKYIRGIPVSYVYVDDLVEIIKEAEPIKEFRIPKRNSEPFKNVQNNDWRNKSKKFNGYNGAN